MAVARRVHRRPQHRIQLHADGPRGMGSQGGPLFRAPADWQLEVWQRSIDTLPTEMLLYASDVFWPCEPEQYREKYLQPQLGLFETATTIGHIAEEGSPTREQYRNMIFFENAYSH